MDVLNMLDESLSSILRALQKALKLPEFYHFLNHYSIN
jgi:hypothetical protein